MSENDGIVRLFLEIADMLAIQGEQQRRINAYKRAADAVAGLGRDVADVAREGTLTEIPGIGKILAAKIEEYLQSGTLELYERLQGEVPPGVVAMLQVPDVGPKTAGRVWKELGVTSVDELEAAARANKVQALPGFGVRSEANILAGIEALRRFSGRTPLGVAWTLAYDMVAALSELPEVLRIVPAGSSARPTLSIPSTRALNRRNSSARASIPAARNNKPISASFDIQPPSLAPQRISDG